MSAVEFIPAKETRYHGVLYRSRLEASWAIYWHHLAELLNDYGFEYSYESFIDRSGVDLRTICEYCPDFRISYGNQKIGNRVVFQEIKPVFPNEEYLRKLRTVAVIIGTGTEKSGIYSLILTVGGFRDKDGPSHFMFPFDDEISLMPTLCDFEGGAEAAKNFRWDLYQDAYELTNLPA